MFCYFTHHPSIIIHPLSSISHGCAHGYWFTLAPTLAIAVAAVLAPNGPLLLLHPIPAPKGLLHTESSSGWSDGAGEEGARSQSKGGDDV